MPQYNVNRGKGYNINVTSPYHYGGGTDDKSPQRTPVNPRNQVRGVHGKQFLNISFRSLAAFGMSKRFASQFNQVVGQYTGRKMRAQQFDAALNLGTMAVAAAKFGPLGMTYAGINTGIKIAQHRIDINNKNIKADIKYEKSGNNTRGRSRQAGAKV